MIGSLPFSAAFVRISPKGAECQKILAVASRGPS